MENKMKNEKIKISSKSIKIFGLIVVVLMIIFFLIFIFKNNFTNNETGKNFEIIDEGGEEVTNIVDKTAQVIPEEARVEVPGASPISKENKVLALNGEVAKNTAVNGSPEAPKPSAPISKEQLPASALNLEISSAKGFSPKAIAVKPGVPLTLSLTSVDSNYHVIKFDDPALNAIAMRVEAGETRAITFNTPEKPGEYTFRCYVTGHEEKEVGKLIVK